MISDSYIKGNSPVHRLSPAIKIALLACFCTAVFLFPSWILLASAVGILLLTYGLAGLRVRHIIQGIKPVLPVLVLIFLAQIYFIGPLAALFILVRFCCLIMAAHLVTVTTRSGEFVDGVMALLRYAPRWVPSENIALAIALSLRFIPLLRSVFTEVRMAQRARGLDGNLLALLSPMIVRTLKSGDQIAEAIRARSPDR